MVFVNELSRFFVSEIFLDLQKNDAKFSDVFIPYLI